VYPSHVVRVSAPPAAPSVRLKRWAQLLTKDSVVLSFDLSLSMLSQDLSALKQSGWNGIPAEVTRIIVYVDMYPRCAASCGNFCWVICLYFEVEGGKR
jgi:hypothetical protein